MRTPGSRWADHNAFSRIMEMVPALRTMGTCLEHFKRAAVKTLTLQNLPVLFTKELRENYLQHIKWHHEIVPKNVIPKNHRLMEQKKQLLTTTIWDHLGKDYQRVLNIDQRSLPNSCLQIIQSFGTGPMMSDATDPMLCGYLHQNSVYMLWFLDIQNFTNPHH